MEKYNYDEAIKNDIYEWLEENGEFYEHEDGTITYDDVYDDMFVADSVTGNGSGSYTFSRWKAEEHICHNLELLKDAIEALGGDYEMAMKSAEDADVTIRCYMLSQYLQEGIDKYNEEHHREVVEEDDEEDNECDSEMKCFE
jgi:hypothetical protein